MLHGNVQNVAESGQVVRTLEGHTDLVLAVAVSADGTQAVSASNDGTVIAWDLATGVPLARFTAEGALRTCMAAPDGRTIVAGGDSGRVHILRLEGVG